MKRLPSILLLSMLAFPVASLSAEGNAAGQPPIKAPTRLYSEPDLYFLLRLPGDRAQVRYTPGSLDRAANLQSRLERVARYFERWAGFKQEISAYVISREEWAQAQFNIPYGVPLRVGRTSLAAPAMGDEGTVDLWVGLLSGILPSVPGVPLRGTPQEAATMAMADVVTQLQAAEILVDEMALSGDAFWVRGLLSHVVSLSLVGKLEPGRTRDLDAMYRLVAEERGERVMSARDYGDDISLEDWLWFQAQFHAGAKLIVAKEGAGDAVGRMLKLRKKNRGLSGDLLLRKYKPLHEWFFSSFATVSFNRGR